MKVQLCQATRSQGRLVEGSEKVLLEFEIPPKQKDKLKREWRSLYQGRRGANEVSIIELEPGMDFKPHPEATEVKDD